MELKAATSSDELTAEAGPGMAIPAMVGADAKALSESELHLASAMISVSSPLPFRLQSEPH